MKTRCKFRGLLSVVLAAALFFYILPWQVRAQGQGTWQRISTLEELTTGRYVLVTGAGYAPGVLQEDWVTAVQPTVSGDTVTDPQGGVWTLTVEGTVRLTDSSGVTISPTADGSNGITAGDYGWSVSCTEGRFSFHGSSGEEAVTFAANASVDYLFRAYKDNAFGNAPEYYPRTFTLYKWTEAAEEPEETTLPQEAGEPEETTQPQEPEASETPQSVTAIAQAKAEKTGTVTVEGTVIWAQDGIVVLQDATGGIALAMETGTLGEVRKITFRWEEDGNTAVTAWETTGTAGLPASEVTVSQLLTEDAWEYTWVLVKGAVLGEGVLSAEGYSIPVTLPALTDIVPGDPVEVYGVVMGGRVYVSSAGDVTKVMEETVPNVACDPAGGSIPAGDPITLSCAAQGADIHYAVSADGEGFSEYSLYTQPILPETGFGTLYIKAYASKDGCSDSGELVWCFTETVQSEWNLYFGQLHSHTDLSDGLGTVEEAFAQAATVEGLDFFAVTDHSNSFDHAGEGTLDGDGSAVSTDWAAGKAAASAVTGETFVGIFGYEMSWQEDKALGHINTYNTPGWLSREQAAFSNQPTALETYYAALATVPGSVSQINHPGTAYGDFEDFSHYSAAADQVMTLLEVGCGDGITGCSYYNRALDLGWHVAPTNSQNNHSGAWGSADAGRTVILAKELTEAELYDAMQHCRVYATEDSDLSILYKINGAIMGSTLSGGTDLTVTAQLSDPTDAVIGLLEVIADGGEVVASCRMEGQGTAELSVPRGYHYYYLRITQPDGDLAVTAPVWVEQYEDMGIASFSCGTAVPVQNREAVLTLQVRNDETVDFVLESIRVTADGETVYTAEAPGTVKAVSTLTHTLSYTHPGLGVTELRAMVTGTVNGERRSYEAGLTLEYLTSGLVSRIVVDGTHGSLPELSRLTALAARARVEVTVVTEELTEALLDSCILVVPAPEVPFSQGFVELAAEFARSGGTLILCGQADALDGEVHIAGELNRLLTAMGSTMSLHDDTAMDAVNNGGAPDQLYPGVYNTASEWCDGVDSGQVYCQLSGCTVDPGSGTWLVKGFTTTENRDADGDGLGGEGNVLLAWETLPSGGGVFVSGGVFLSDSQMKEQKNYWDPASINQTVLENLLGIEQVQWPLSTVSQVRSGKTGEVYRIRGFVTAGTANPYNTFYETIYLQDDTGGIAVVPVTQTGIQVGAPVEVIGYLDTREGNPVLEVMDYLLLEEEYYRYVPKTTRHKTAMDYETNGGSLMQVEGEVVSVTYTADKKGVCRFTLKDEKGDLATVLIEEEILSGAYGVNDLAARVRRGATVRAIGIVHLSDGGTVLRVRNCDEVVYVPPVEIPDTGDSIGGALLVCLGSLTALTAIGRKRKK